MLASILNRHLLSLDRNAENGVEFDGTKENIGKDVSVIYSLYEKRSEDGYELRGIFNPMRCPPKFLNDACDKANDGSDEWLVVRFEIDHTNSGISVCPDISGPEDSEIAALR